MKHRLFSSNLQSLVWVFLGFQAAFFLLQLINLIFKPLRMLSTWDHGLILVALLLFGIDKAPVMFLAALVAFGLYDGTNASFTQLVSLSLSLTAIYSVAAYALVNLLKIDLRLERIQDVFSFALVGLVATIPVSIFSNIDLPLGDGSPEGLLFDLLGGWMIKASCLMILAPLLLVHGPKLWAHFGREGFRFSRIEPKRIGIIALQAGTIAAAILSTFWLRKQFDYRAFYPIIIPLFWIGLDYGIGGATLATALISGSTILFARQFGVVDPIFLKEMDIFLLILSLTSLGIGAIVSERRESQDRFTKIFLHSPIPIGLTLLKTGQYIDANDTFLQAFGFSREEVIGRTPQELNILEHFEDRDRMLETVRHLGAVRNYTCRVRKREGEIREALVSLEKVDLGKRILVVEMYNDVTDQKLAEARIRHLSSFPGLNPNPIVEISLDRKLVYYNPAAEAVFTKKYLETDGFLSGEIDQILEEINRENKVSFNREIQFNDRAFDAFIHYEADFNSLRIYMFDVTNKKHAEEEIRQRITELEALHEFGLNLGYTQNEEEIGEKLIQTLSRHMSWHHAVLRLRKNGSGKSIEVVALSHPGWTREQAEAEKERLQTVVTGVGKGLSGWVIEHGQAVRSGDVTNDSRYFHSFEGIHSGLYVPLIINDRAIGSIAVESEMQDGFDVDDERLLTTLAAQAASAIENVRLFSETRESLSREQRINGITQAISSSLDIETILQSVVSLTAELINARCGFMAVLSEDGHTLNYPYLHNVPDLWDQQPDPDEGSGIVWRIIKTMRPVLMSDYASHPDALEAGVELGIKALLGFPIFAGNSCYGALILYNDTGDAYFTTRDLALVESVGRQAGIAIQNARLFSESRRRMREMEALLQTYETISGTLELKPLLENILSAACRAIPAAEKGTIMLSDTEGYLRVRAQIGYTEKLLSGLKFNGNQGYVSRVFREKRPYLVRDAHAEYEVPLDGRVDEVDAVLSGVSAPLLHKEQAIGVISLDNTTRTAAFSETDMRLLGAFASSAAVAIDNARLFDETRMRFEELSMLSEVSQALRTASNRDEMLPVILDELMRLLGAGGAAFALCDPTGNPFFELGRGEWETWTGFRLDPGAGITGSVIDNGQAYFNNTILNDEQVLHPELLGGLEAVACVPLSVEGNTFGALWMGKQFVVTENEQRLVTAIANIAANAIHRTTLHERIVHYAYQLSLINALGRGLATSQDLNSIYRAAHDYVKEIFDYTIFGISLIDVETGMVRMQFAANQEVELDAGLFPVFRFDPQGSAGSRNRAIATSQPVIESYPEGSDSPAFNWSGTDESIRSAIYTPIIVEGKVIGLLDMVSAKSNMYSEESTELANMVANQIGLAIQNVRLFQEKSRRVEQLAVLHEVDSAISASIDLRSIMKIVVEHVRKQLNVDAADILLFNPHTLFLEYASGQGFLTGAISQTWVRMGEDLPGKVIQDRRPLHVPDLRSHGRTYSRASLLAAEAFVSYYGIPLIAKGQVKGVLEIFHRSVLNVNQEFSSFLEMIAGQTGIAIDNAAMFENLERANLELTASYDATIEGWSRALELRDEETEGHTRRVMEMTVSLASAMGLSDEKLVQIRRGALLHDIGKIAVPDHILRKPGPLDEQEWVLMRRHPVQAYEMLSSISYLRPALDIPHYHHEKWDGTGYPDRLKGEQIPLAARIFAVADVFDALTSDRPYRAAWSREKAIEYLREQSSKHFDPAVVEVFLRLNDR